VKAFLHSSDVKLKKGQAQKRKIEKCETNLIKTKPLINGFGGFLWQKFKTNFILN
jgi:hypothetical protein